MYPVARLKAAYRFIVFHLFCARLTEWHYDNPAEVAGYLGGYNWRGKVMVFKRGDGTLQYMW